MKRYLWFAVRLALIAYFAVGVRSMTLPASEGSESIPGMLFAFTGGTLTTRFWIIRQYRGRPPVVPSWFNNPFDLANPFEFFHLFAMALIVLSVTRSSADGAVAAAMMFTGMYGAGVLSGIYWAVYAKRETGSQRA